MEINGDVLTIDIDMSMEEILEFEEFIRPRIDYIEVVEVEENGLLRSPTLLSLLASLKRTRPELQIPFLDKKVISSPIYGIVHWIYHD
ncbi:hypothetical protein KKA17_08900 [bacterium]|nr:hypothetical protein [bacterium]MBU1883052.1 hypothetical protein [bacterium]